MIEFGEAWQTLAIGARVRVSNGSIEPPGGIALSIWRSHNHEGEVVEFLDGPPRAIRVQLDEVEGVQVAYDVAEGSGDRFESV